MFAAASDTINVLYILVTILGTAMATALGIYSTIIAPRDRDRRAAEVEREALVAAERERQDKRDRFMDGVKAEPGMTEQVLPAAVRLQGTEDAIIKLAQRVDETNGTGRRTERKVDLLVAAFPDIKVPTDLIKL